VGEGTGHKRTSGSHSSHQAEIEQLLQAREEEAGQVEPVDEAKLEQMLVSFEKAINRNQRQRSKHPADPSKFMDSEIELSEEIKKLAVVAASPELFPRMVELGGVTSILGLLTHENTDVSIAVLEVLHEMLDVKDLSLLDEQESACMQILVDAVLANAGLELLVQNLYRLDESEEEDAVGAHYTLSLLESVCLVCPRWAMNVLFTLSACIKQLRPSLAEALCEKTSILKFLLQRFKSPGFDSNKNYSCEVLCILLQGHTTNQQRLGDLEGIDGVDSLLQCIYEYRKREELPTDEIEYPKNLFNALCAVLLVPEHQNRFRMHEGFQLMIR
jgi:beta-catenin-like protein 1